MEEAHIIIVGDILDGGWKIVGPFHDSYKAGDAATKITDETDLETRIVSLTSLEEFFEHVGAAEEDDGED